MDKNALAKCCSKGLTVYNLRICSLKPVDCVQYAFFLEVIAWSAVCMSTLCPLIGLKTNEIGVCSPALLVSCLCIIQSSGTCFSVMLYCARDLAWLYQVRVQVIY